MTVVMTSVQSEHPLEAGPELLAQLFSQESTTASNPKTIAETGLSDQIIDALLRRHFNLVGGESARRLATEPLEITIPYSGLLHCFVAFDWGEEINLNKVRKLVPAQVHDLPRKSQAQESIAYHLPPLRFDLSPSYLELPVVGRVKVQFSLMVFDFGAVSVEMQVPFQLSSPEMTRFAAAIRDKSIFVKSARESCEWLYRQIKSAIDQPHWVDISEEYFVFQVIPDSTTPAPAKLLERSRSWLAGLVRLETGALSDNEISEALRLRLSYSPQDLIVTDLPAAVIIEKDCSEILETMAFANLQLLEFRQIDRHLDERLRAARGLIQQLARTNRPNWNVHTRRLRELGALKVEVTLMLEKASNALTLVGDPYLASVYDQVAARFHLDQWRENIRRSINVLESIYQVVSNQAASYRAETLEIAIVVLFVVEIVMAMFRH